MYRVFVDGKYIGDHEKLPWLGGKCYYLYDRRLDTWIVQTSTNWYSVKPEKVPKEYRALNLIL